MACDAAGCLGEELRPAGRGSGRHEVRGAKGRAMSKMTLKTEGDKHVVVTRRFAASPEAVYRAHTEPRLIQKWLLGPEARRAGRCPFVSTRRDRAGRSATS